MARERERRPETIPRRLSIDSKNQKPSAVGSKNPLNLPDQSHNFFATIVEVNLYDFAERRDAVFFGVWLIGDVEVAESSASTAGMAVPLSI